MSIQALQNAIQPLLCTGDPFERGYTQGRTYARQIYLCLNALYHSEAFRLLKPWWLPHNLGTLWVNFKAGSHLQPALHRLYPDYLHQLAGMAQGAGVPLQSLLFACAAELLFSRLDCHPGGGTSMGVPKELSATGTPFLVKNFDAPFFQKSSQIVRQSRPLDGLASLEITLLPHAGTYAGLNEAGVAIVSNQGYGKVPFETFIPLSIRIQEALHRCRSAEEVDAFLQDGRQAGQALLTVLDVHGSLLSVEIAGNQVTSRPVANNVLLHTNHYQIAEMVALNVPTNAYYTQQNIPALRGKRIRESSEGRFDRLCELTGTKIQFEEDDILRYFTDHGNQDGGDDNTICRHGKYFESTASLLIRPQSREIKVALGNPCDTAFTTFSL